MIVLLKICATDKIFGKICLKIIRNTFFSNMWSAISGGTRGLKVLVRGDIQQKEKLQTYRFVGRHPTQFPSLVGYPDLPIRKTLSRVLGLFTEITLKRVSESICFESHKFTTCKVKDEKEVANSLMTFNLPKIIHPFQGKRHLRT